MCENKVKLSSFTGPGPPSPVSSVFTVLANAVRTPCPDSAPPPELCLMLKPPLSPDCVGAAEGAKLAAINPASQVLTSRLQGPLG